MATVLPEIAFPDSHAHLEAALDAVVHDGQPTILYGSDHENAAIIVPRDLVRDILRSFAVRVDFLPEDDGSMSLWVHPMNIGCNEPTVQDAENALLLEVRQFIRHFFAAWDHYKQFPEQAALRPYVLRLALAYDDDELKHLLFSPDEA